MTISIEELFSKCKDTCKLTWLAGKSGRLRDIAIPKIQKPGLALTGYAEQLHPGRLLVLGGTEIDFLGRETPANRKLGLKTMMESEPACIVITRGLEPPNELIEIATKRDTPLLVSKLISSAFINTVRNYLQENLSPSTTAHGVLVDVLGIGILIIGKSGIGKSEAALDLVTRGHRLVADDVVALRQVGPNLVYGQGEGIIKHHMEIRGLGIINIKDLYGHSSVRDLKKVELVIELFDWNADVEHERLGFEDRFHALLGEELPFLAIPVRPGRNVATIVEVAARNQLLKLQGRHSAKIFKQKMNEEMEKKLEE